MNLMLNLNAINKYIYHNLLICLAIISHVCPNEWEDKGIYPKKEHSLVKPYQGKCPLITALLTITISLLTITISLLPVILTIISVTIDSMNAFIHCLMYSMPLTTI